MRTIILVCLALVVPALTLPAVYDGPAVDADPKQLLEYWGYKVNVYDVETLDGYILKLYNVPRGRNETNHVDTPRPVVFLQHGLGTSAADWLINSPDQSAGYIFADGGFDVWLGNFRGSKYARRHKNFGPEAQQFWQYSWNDMAMQDLPAMIKKITDVSKAEKIYYVAHSLGTTAGFALFSQQPNLAKKIKQFHAIAPLAILENVQGVLKYTKSFLKDTQLVSQLFSSGEFPGEYTPNTQLQSAWSKYVCRDPEHDLLCKNVLLMISGPNTRQIDERRIESINAHSPAGISIQTVVHLGQMLDHGMFKAYDYGSPALNKAHYGTDNSQPPVYSLASMMGIPVFLYSSECDWIAEPLDVRTTASFIRTTELVSNVVVPTFNHMDFIWGTRAAAEIYKPIMASIGGDFKLI
jgi:pimeloyl-ACP methyl ester carboxylesterase